MHTWDVNILTNLINFAQSVLDIAQLHPVMGRPWRPKGARKSEAREMLVLGGLHPSDDIE